jgi:fructan beta-fructosidase
VSWPTHRQIRFYASPNLKDWTHLSDFGPAGSTKGIWECPDLFPVSMENRRGEQKWVLVVNVGSDAPAGGSGCQYFVGGFDGKQFTPDASPKPGPALWADYGPDFYAAVSWSDVPKNDGRRLWLGWMSNWQYANDVPTAPWRSAMSVPRELTLRSTPDGLRLLQQPVAELRKQREKAPRHFRGGTLAAAGEWLQRKEQSSLPELFDLELALSGFATNSVCTLELRTGSDDHVSVVLDGARQRLTLDRARSGKTDFHRAFPARAEAPLPVRDGRLTLRLLVDTSSVEIFAQDGEAVMTALFLPHAGPRHLRLLNADHSPAARVDRLQIHPLRSAW